MVENGRVGEKLPQKSKSVAVSLHKKDNENKMEKWELVPPDGGWGWLVLLGSTVVNLLVPGTVKSFGVLFVEFLEVFETSPAVAAWIPALCYFLYSSLGPISSILSVKYSYRTVTIIGGTFAAVGMILSYFAQSVIFLYFSYGVLVGTGAGLAFPPTVYIVTSYFVKFRGIANGICISGSAIGSIILPPFLRFLLETYGYRGAVLIMGGITLNCWVAALFYDPVEKHHKKVAIQINDRKESKQQTDAIQVPNMAIKFSPEDEEAYYDVSTENDNFVPSISQSNSKVNCVDSNGEIRTTSSSILLPLSKHVMDSQRKPKPHRSPSTSSFQYVSTPYHGSTLTLQPEVFTSNFSLKASNSGVFNKQKQQEEAQKKKFFDISLLKDPIYLVILISNSTNAISYTNFIILLPLYAGAMGFDKTKSALLLSIVSCFDLIGRIGGSALSDYTTFPKEWYFIGGLLCSGVSLALLPLATSYTTLSVFCSLFGLASGVYVGITAVIMAHLLGTERLQSTYGISLFVNGILQLIGPPICGYFFQVIESYSPIFSSLGVILIVGASIWIVIPCIKHK